MTICHNIKKEVLKLTKQILVLVDYNQTYLDRIQDLAQDYDLIQTLEEADFSQVEIVLGWDSDLEDVIAQGDHSIKWIQAKSAGVDYLPLDLLADQGIILTSASGMHAQAITETVFAMILGYSRQVFQSRHYQANKYWGQEDVDLFELKGKTLAVVGLGNIGQKVADIAKAFGLQVVGVNQSGTTDAPVDAIYPSDQMDSVLGQADIVVNILPLTDQTRGLYNADRFQAFKDQSVFINVGRGPSVVTEDLVAALNERKIAFCGLDVFEEEPLPETSPLWEMDNVLITPHIAGEMADYNAHLFPIIEANLSSYINQQDVALNKIDYQKEY